MVTRPEKHKRLLFLPGPANRSAQTLLNEQKEKLGNRFVTIPFQFKEHGPSIVQWLEQCAAACEAENVRLFIKDLAQYLRTEFSSGEVNFMNEDAFTSMMMPLVRKNKAHIGSQKWHQNWSGLLLRPLYKR
jgi:hypothetical protein